MAERAEFKWTGVNSSHRVVAVNERVATLTTTNGPNPTTVHKFFYWNTGIPVPCVSCPFSLFLFSVSMLMLIMSMPQLVIKLTVQYKINYI